MDIERLKKALSDRGYSITKFSENILGKPYGTFYHQIKNDTIPNKDIDIILERTELRYEELFGRGED